MFHTIRRKMALLINSIFRRLLNSATEGEGAWYASLKFRTPVELKQVATSVSKRTSISEHDTLAVISVLSELIPEYLINGHSVHLDKLGVFRLSINSTGHENEEDVSSESIKSTKIRFLPAVDMKKAIKGASYIKIDK